MKILIIAFTFPPNKDGVSEAASTMAQGFAGRGWDVEILTEVCSPARNTVAFSGLKFHEFTYTEGKHPRILVGSGNQAYGNFLTSGAWDVVIIHTYTRSLTHALPYLAEMRAKKVLVSHGYPALVWVPTGRFPFGLRSYCKRVLRSFRMFRWIWLFDRVVYLSEQADLRGFYDHTMAKMVKHRGRRVIPNGIDPDLRGSDPDGFRESLGIPDSAFMFICVANYSPRKDQGYAARAFRRAALPGAVLVFIGSDFNEHSERFRQEDAQHGENAPGRIIWLEKQTREKTLDAIAACDAFLLSANHEAQPIALLEAMREGKPWVARRAGCIERMEGGICVRSEKSMAEAIRQLADDPNLRSRLSGEGLQAVKSRYTQKAYVESFCSLAEELVATKN